MALRWSPIALVLACSERKQAPPPPPPPPAPIDAAVLDAPAEIDGPARLSGREMEILDMEIN